VIFAVSLLLVALSIGIHFEALWLVQAMVARMPGIHRVRVAVAVLFAIIAHLVEVVVFGLGWAFLVDSGAAPLSVAAPSVSDLVYFSGAVYTSLGFGDIVPLGPSRVLAIVEAVTGLVLIAWTASFTYFEMRANWENSGD
jgi:hypothetical protein